MHIDKPSIDPTDPEYGVECERSSGSIASAVADAAIAAGWDASTVNSSIASLVAHQQMLHEIN